MCRQQGSPATFLGAQRHEIALGVGKNLPEAHDEEDHNREDMDENGENPMRHVTACNGPENTAQRAVQRCRCKGPYPNSHAYTNILYSPGSSPSLLSPLALRDGERSVKALGALGDWPA